MNTHYSCHTYFNTQILIKLMVKFMKYTYLQSLGLKSYGSFYIYISIL